MSLIRFRNSSLFSNLQITTTKRPDTGQIRITLYRRDGVPCQATLVSEILRTVFADRTSEYRLRIVVVGTAYTLILRVGLEDYPLPHSDIKFAGEGWAALMRFVEDIEIERIELEDLSPVESQTKLAILSAGLLELFDEANEIVVSSGILASQNKFLLSKAQPI